jgi:AcrR family transcriptional regulator
MTVAVKVSKREITRSKVIRAAIDCIYEEGFYAAHTNRIAEKAGVSWGVIQYHFGDKDGLLQAVLDDYFDYFTDTLAQTNLSDEQLSLRIHSLIEVVWSLVSKREYRVSIAILRNAGRSKDSSINGQNLTNIWAKKITPLWRQLFFGLVEEPANSETVKRLMFATLRGLADELNPKGKTSSKGLKEEFSALGDALSFLLEN